MRINKRAVYWTTGISIVTLCVCLFCYPYSAYQLVYDLALACFGSAVLALIVAIIGYQTEKRASMEAYYQKAEDAIRCMKQIRHLEFDAPDELVRAALREESNNLIDAVIGLEEHEAKNNLLGWLEQKMSIPSDQISKEELSKILGKQYQETLKWSEDTLNRTIQGYLAFIEMDLRPFGNAYARLDFILRNKKMKDLTYKQLYGKIQSFQNECRIEKSLFSSYLEKKQAVWVCVDKIQELDQKLYREENDALYAYAVDELNDSLDTFWEKMYGEELIREEHVPVRVLLNFEDAQQVKEHEERRKREVIIGRSKDAEIDAEMD